jgi:hypothetical protein
MAKQVRTIGGSGWLNVIILNFILEKQVAKLQPSATADGSDQYIDSKFAIVFNNKQSGKFI